MLITSDLRCDGFGAQFQTIIYNILYASYYGYTYIYRPITKIGIYKDEELYKNLNNYLNLDKYYGNIYKLNNISNIKIIPFNKVVSLIENNIDFFLTSPVLQNLKSYFWENKSKIKIYNNNKINIAIHIRRHNKHDFINNELRNYHSLEYYLSVINNLRKIYKENYIIHVFSQGTLEEFSIFKCDDVELHIDTNSHQDDFMETFCFFVAADILLTSKSSFSYIAAYFCEGTIYYDEMFHKPSKNWLKLSDLKDK